MRKIWIVGALLMLGGIAAFAVAAQKGEAAKELSTIAEKLGQAGSYAFKAETEVSGMQFGGRPGGPGGGDQERPTPPPIVGKYKKGEPVYFERDGLEAYRGPNGLVFKDADGSWKGYDPRQAFGGRRGGRPGEGGGEQPPGREGRGNREGGDRGGAGGGERRGGDAARRGSMMSLMEVSRTRIPHDILEGLGDKAQDILRATEGDKAVYTVTLTPEAAREVGGFGGPGGMQGRGNRTPPESTGKILVTVSAAGAIEKIVVETETKMTFGDRTNEMKRTTTYLLSDIGSTQVEVPEAARKELGAERGSSRDSGM